VKCGGAGEPSLCECERGDVEVTLGCIRAALSAMGDSWSCLSCLGVEEPPPRPRRRIDKSLIGLPTDFQHTGHIGSSEFGNSDLGAVQTRMQSKGGYSNGSDVPDTATPTGTFVGSYEH